MNKLILLHMRAGSWLKNVLSRVATWQANILLAIVFFFLTPFFWLYFLVSQKKDAVPGGWHSWQERTDRLEDLRAQ